MSFIAIQELCSGCRACELACALENFKEINPSMAALRIVGRFPSPGDYQIQLCDQCGSCAEACPEDAITLHGNAYLIDRELCINCLLCVEACPLGVMYVHDNSEIPIKCTLCGACARICPREAIVLQGGA